MNLFHPGSPKTLNKMKVHLLSICLWMLTLYVKNDFLFLTNVNAAKAASLWCRTAPAGKEITRICPSGFSDGKSCFIDSGGLCIPFHHLFSEVSGLEPEPKAARRRLTWILPSLMAGPSSARRRMKSPMLYSFPPLRLKPKPRGPRSSSTG